MRGMEQGWSNACGRFCTLTSVWERLSEPVQRSIFYAQQYADQLHQKRVTADLLFLGLVTDREDEAAVLLAELGVNVDEVWGAMQNFLVKRWWCWPSPHTLTPDGKEVFDRAAREADALALALISSGLVIAGLVAAGNGEAAKLLRERGVEASRLIQAMESRREDPREAS